MNKITAGTAEGDLKTVEEDLKRFDTESPATKKVRAVPEGHHTVTPYLIINGALNALEYYKRAFGAVETFKMLRPDGRLGHAEIKIGDSLLMMSDEFPELGGTSPERLKGSAVKMFLYVDDVDAVFKKAVQAGGTEVMPVQTQFYGDRTGQLKDPYGHFWWVATHVEDVSPEELKKRVAKMGKGEGQ